MAEPNVVIRDDIATAAVEFYINGLSMAVQRRGKASFVLAGGGTPLALYRSMALAADGSMWERVHFFWGDERLVQPDDPGSNYGAAWETFLSRVPVPIENIHRIKGELPAGEAAADYTEQLRAWAATHDPGSPNPWPRFDLVVLGLGEDGHTASLFPGSPVVTDEPVMAVTADYGGRPAGRVTLTPLAFNDAREIAFLVTGSDKAGAVHGTFVTDDPGRFPARRIRPAAGRVTWFLDRAASAALDSQ